MGTKYNPRAKADKNLIVISVPNFIIADATAAVFVGTGNICRIKGTAGGFVKFGDSTVEVPSVSTSETIETEAGFFQVASTNAYIRTSVPMRVEIIND